MSEASKVKLSPDEIAIAYEEVGKACMRQNDASNQQSASQGLDVLKKYFGGSEPLLDVNQPVPNFKGWTPIVITSFFKRVEETKYLISVGAKPDIEFSEEKLTSFHIAASLGSAIICKYCLNYGMNIDIQTALLKTPLMHACESGSMETVSLLMSEKLNLKLKDIENKDCIDYAQKNNYSNIVRFIQYKFLDQRLSKNTDTRRSVGKI